MSEKEKETVEAGREGWGAIFECPVWRESVRFADFDATGTVNYATYLQYVDDAVFAWWSAVELPFQPQPADFGLVTVAMSAAWTQLVECKGMLEVVMRIVDVRRTSFRMDAVLRVEGRSAPCFVARLVQVYWRQGRSTLIPDGVRDQLLAKAWTPAQAELVESVLFRDRS